MLIAGVEKLTLLDYPGKLAAIVFTYGCNMRCPYCHNPELVTSPFERGDNIPQEEVLDWLGGRRDKLDGVVITGGEPTMQKDLTDFIRAVKKIGYMVKLDTNCSYPDRVKKLIDSELIDYWAVDVKFGSELYKQGINGGAKIDDIGNALSMIMDSGQDYEFRTTVMRGIHDKKAMKQIGKMIEGADRYFIQNFRPGKTIDKDLNRTNSFTVDELAEFKDVMEEFVDKVVVRE